ncbi:MAG: molybdopterin adenylyltransferase, partial [Gammaproteobacteria bacterium]|nr:molybdopterin adenylyltransferase [Gammaproteobacteria bacterium]
MQKKIRIGILTVSDRASAGIYEDISGQAIRETLTEYLSGEWEAVYRLIADERPQIEETLCELVDEEKCCLVITTGGTGPALR